jgi:hypothetical protein
MMSLNQRVSNSNDGYASRQIDEYWSLTEKSISTQQYESRSNNPIAKTVVKEGGNISSSVNFQISLHEITSIYDLHNSYLKFDAEKEFVFTIETQVNNAITVCLPDKQASVYFNQMQIWCNEAFIVDSLDFF